MSLALITAVFALLFEYLPERHIAWRDVWLGVAVSAVLFVVGQFLLGWYLGRAGISSSYGSFGGIVVFLLWAYYSAQILPLGAEFTHIYAVKFGSLKASALSAQNAVAVRLVRLSGGLLAQGELRRLRQAPELLDRCAALRILP